VEKVAEEGGKRTKIREWRKGEGALALRIVRFSKGYEGRGERGGEGGERKGGREGERE